MEILWVDDGSYIRDRAAGVLLVEPRRGGGRHRYLLLRRVLGDHAGTWSIPGGGREPRDKTRLATAQRELREETGLQIRPFAPIAVILYRDDGFEYATYVVPVPQLPEDLELNDEHDAVMHATLPEIVTETDARGDGFCVHPKLLDTVEALIELDQRLRISGSLVP